MQKLPSPGVVVKETDLTAAIRAANAVAASVVIHAKKGPVFEPTLITSEKQFLNTFGMPDPAMGLSFYAAHAAVTSGCALQVVRVLTDQIYASTYFQAPPPPDVYEPLPVLSVDAGRNQTIICDPIVYLKGEIVYQDEASYHTFEWEQLSGGPVALADADTLEPFFIRESYDQDVYIFRLWADKGSDIETFSEVTVSSRIESLAVYSATASRTFRKTESSAGELLPGISWNGLPPGRPQRTDLYQPSHAVGPAFYVNGSFIQTATCDASIPVLEVRLPADVWYTIQDVSYAESGLESFYGVELYRWSGTAWVMEKYSYEGRYSSKNFPIQFGRTYILAAVYKVSGTLLREYLSPVSAKAFEHVAQGVSSAIHGATSRRASGHFSFFQITNPTLLSLLGESAVHIPATAISTEQFLSITRLISVKFNEDYAYGSTVHLAAVSIDPSISSFSVTRSSGSSIGG